MNVPSSVSSNMVSLSWGTGDSTIGASAVLRSSSSKNASSLYIGVRNIKQNSKKKKNKVIQKQNVPKNEMNTLSEIVNFLSELNFQWSELSVDWISSVLKFCWTKFPVNGISSERNFWWTKFPVNWISCGVNFCWTKFNCSKVSSPSTNNFVTLILKLYPKDSVT